ncbi:MAG: stage IV sporulation protein A [Ruminococcaceae bacterium]|nr:stage IV sporulation protein A [Oscillospiraceae bacterium]
MDTSNNIYDDICKRTGGDIYIGVVGPVRTGKSTFIKKFMDTLVIPNIKEDSMRQRANDELPQSSGGRTIMTTEPKFIPEDAVDITVGDTAHLRVRMIDCVGYIVPSSLGYIEDDQPRMVKTPWFEKEIPFNLAAEIGTQKVISEHSTIGLVVTTDGSISDIPREEYEGCEERVINELKEIEKPFIVLLNCKNPQSDKSRKLAEDMSAKYGVSVLPVNCMKLTESEIRGILEQVLFSFPIKQVSFDLPQWLSSLSKEHPVRRSIYDAVKDASSQMKCVRDIFKVADKICTSEHIEGAKVSSVDLSDGSGIIKPYIKDGLFFEVLGEKTGMNISNESELMKNLIELTEMKKKYMNIKDALDEVEATGYGIVTPTLEELKLEEPEIMKQGGRYGVRLRASAPSIHMMKANINTEVAPIVGSESQSEELVNYLLKEFEESPAKIWESNIFGKSLNELVGEGLHNKLYRMPTDARMRIQETLEKVINEGCNGLICIIL